ncbi:MAG TPA: hypothetical protein VGK48_14260 [Terriglobia bacterium]
MFLVCPAPPAARAEVIDKMVAVVEGHVITLSDLRQEREIRTRLGDKPENDDTALIRDMIDNYLIEKQSSDFPGVDVSPEEIDRELQKSPPQEGVPSPAIRAAIGRRLRMQKYFDLRFRQFIRPSDQDLQKYYDEVFVPEAKNRGLDPIPPLASITDAIRNNVVQEQINHDVDGWLEAIRARSNIEIFQ